MGSGLPCCTVSIWTLSHMDAADIPDPKAGDVAHYVLSAAEKLATGCHCPYPGEYIRCDYCHYPQLFVPNHSQIGIKPLTARPKVRILPGPPESRE